MAVYKVCAVDDDNRKVVFLYYEANDCKSKPMSGIWGLKVSGLVDVGWVVKIL